jgi:hypothetical protein
MLLFRLLKVIKDEQEINLQLQQDQARQSVMVQVDMVAVEQRIKTQVATAEAAALDPLV